MVEAASEFWPEAQGERGARLRVDFAHPLEAEREQVLDDIVGQPLGNVALDTVVGSVPLLGSVFDLFFKANNRNVRLLQRHLERQGRAGQGR